MDTGENVVVLRCLRCEDQQTQDEVLPRMRKEGDVGMKSVFWNGFCDGLLIGMLVAFLIIAITINI